MARRVAGANISVNGAGGVGVRAFGASTFSERKLWKIRRSALAEESLAVDDGSALATDLSGNARVVGASVDLGAYESRQEVVSAAFAESVDDFDFFVDEDDLNVLASRLI